MLDPYTDATLKLIPLSLLAFTLELPEKQLINQRLNWVNTKIVDHAVNSNFKSHTF